MATAKTPVVSPDAAAAYRAAGCWRDRTVVDDLRDVASLHPDKVAAVTYRVDRRVPETLSYGQLARLVDRVAGGLVELGVRSGDVVSLQLPNWWQFSVLVLACGRIGAVTSPLPPILRRREVGFALERTQSKVCVVPDIFRGFDHANMVADLARGLPSLEHAFVTGHAPPGTERFDDHFLDQRWEERLDTRELDALAPHPDELAQIQFTSGTTGEPKGVMHTHNTLYAGVRTIPDALGLGADDVVLMASTMGHQTGYLYGALMPFSYGMKVVYQDVWNGSTMLDIVADEGVTWTMGATPFVIDTLAAARERPRAVPTLRFFTTAGAPIPPHLVDATEEVLGTTRLVAVWGMTENGAVTVTRPDDPKEVATVSDGRPMPWMELKVVDGAGAEVPRGDTGRLLARGAAQFIGYFKRDDLYRAALDDDGWLDTGDLARMDDRGRIRIAGRSKDLVIRGGENVPVAEVEAALYRHPSVREVAVVGVRDERLGERVCVVVVPAGSPPTLEDIAGHLQEYGMAKQFWPERIMVVDELPKTPSGKVQKFRLREQLAGEGDT
ncbi:MAG: AMP-binding protein [Streptosporangiales bacterium]|nr:AMP-binding protein [Streptosporangiales bacterium]